jgi:two-component system chemotaxis response regulator CheB
VTAAGSTAPIERLVAIGASTGGPVALRTIFHGLTAAAWAPVVMSQHLPADFTRAFARRLDRQGALRVLQAEDGMALRRGCAYVAPGGQHLELVRHAQGHLLCQLQPRLPRDAYVPSIDRLFASCARAAGSGLLAVVLTGMGDDGSAGVRHVAAAGGQVICESAVTAAIASMPQAARDTGCVDAVLPLSALVKKVQLFASGG